MSVNKKIQKKKAPVRGNSRKSSTDNQRSKTGNRAVVKNSRSNRSEVIAVAIFASAIFLFFCLLNKVGYVGLLFRDLMFGLFGGFSSYLIVASMVFLAWSLLRGTYSKHFSIGNWTLFIILLIFLGALIHTFKNDYTYEDASIWRIIGDLWNSSRKNFACGGIIGGSVSLILQRYTEKAGTFLILVPINIIVSMILFSLSFVRAVNKATPAFSSINRKVRTIRGRFKNSSYGQIRDNDYYNNEDYSGNVPADKNIVAIKKPAKISEYYDEIRPDDDDVVILPPDQMQIPVVADNSSEREIGMDGFGHKIQKQKIQKEKIPEADLSAVEKMPAASASFSEPNKNIFKYVKPPFSLLKESTLSAKSSEEQKSSATLIAKKLEDVLTSFGISAKVVHISRGPSVTRYELQPNSGVKVSRIKNLADDIALNLAAKGLRIEAPIPGKAAIGIEIANSEVEMVFLRSVLETDEFLNHKSKIAVCLGYDVSGEPVIADLAKMPHLLVAGSTGSGKSVCINCIIMSLLYRAIPEEVKLIMIDPKVVELGVYNGIPHLMIPVVKNPKKAAGALAWAVQEMTNRYNLFADSGVRDMSGYNEWAVNNGKEKIPHIIIIIDELADLMMVAHDTVEESICRLAQMARAAGMHLVIATQRPSVDVITGLIKANIPSRISFKVASQIDARTILDVAGAEKLLGRGDMLFMPVGSMKATRVQGAFVSDNEVEDVVEFLKKNGEATYDESIIEEVTSGGDDSSQDDDEERSGGSSDKLLPEAIRIAIDMRGVSTSYLQRRLGIGYNRAAKLVDLMEEKGIISGKDGNNKRVVLVDHYEE